MPNRIPTPGIATPTVRKSAAAQPAMKPVESLGGHIAGYAKNVVKEYGDWRKNENSANAGQFYGALLQGRRYDAKGKQK